MLRGMQHALRIVGLCLAGVASAVAAVAMLAGAWMLVAPIAPLLPKGEAVACFATRDNLGKRLWFGRPDARDDTPAVVDHLRLKLTRYGEEERDAEHVHRRWHYSFTTTLAIRSEGAWSDGGQCDWTDDRLSRHQFDLGCYQDCDGGSLSLYRLPFTRALILDWNFLVMQPHGAVSNRDDTPVLFRLDPVPAADCAERVPQ